MAAENDMELVGNAADGVEALAMVAQLKPDILLLDLVRPSWTGLRYCAACLETGAKPHVIVLFGLCKHQSCDGLLVRRGGFLFAQACDTPVLLNRIRQLAGTDRPAMPSGGFDAAPSPHSRAGRTADLEAVVTDIIHEIGVPAHIRLSVSARRPSSLR